MPIRPGSPIDHADLDREEARLAALLAAGHASEAIAEELGISTNQLLRRLNALERKVSRKTSAKG